MKRKHMKKANSGVLDSGLFGTVDGAKSTNMLKNSKAVLLVVGNVRTQRLVQDAVKEAEYRKAQAIALIRQIHLT